MKNSQLHGLLVSGQYLMILFRNTGMGHVIGSSDTFSVKYK